MKPQVTIIVLNWNGLADTLECLESLARLDYLTYEVVVVDNGSTDGSVEAIRTHFPQVTLIENGENLGYAGGNNVGIEYALEAGTDYVLLLNSDTVVDSQMLDHLVHVGESDSDVGIVGPKIYYYHAPEVIWSAGGRIGALGKPCQLGLDEIDTGQHDSVREVDYVTGCALLAKASLIQQIGDLDSRFFAYYEDAEWCARARRHHYKVIYVPQARVWHKIQPRTQEQAPYYLYLMTRNQLLYLKTTRAGLVRISYVILRDSLWPFIKWTIRGPRREQRSLRKVAIRAVFDFLCGRLGEMPTGL